MRPVRQSGIPGSPGDHKPDLVSITVFLEGAPILFIESVDKIRKPLLVMQGAGIVVKQLASWKDSESVGESLQSNSCESAAFRMTVLGGEKEPCQIAS